MKTVLISLLLISLNSLKAQTVYLTYDSYGNRLKKDVISLVPTPVITGPSGPVCKGQTFQLSVIGGTNYLWFNRQTTSSITLVADSSRTYSVTAFNMIGCSAVAFYKLSVGTCSFYSRAATTDQNEQPKLVSEDQNSDWSLYPNPASNGTTVRLSVSQPENVLITVYDEMGRKMTNRTASRKSVYSILLEKSLFPTSGIYFIQLSCNGKQSIKKLWVTY